MQYIFFLHLLATFLPGFCHSYALVHFFFPTKQAGGGLEKKKVPKYAFSDF